MAKDRKFDFEELMDDEEVTIHLPRKGADERDLPGVEIRDVPGAPVTQWEDWFIVEPLHGARPKWNRVGRPTLVKGAGVITPPRRDADEHGGLWAPGIPFPAGPVGTLSPSDFGSVGPVGPVGPVGTLSLSDHVGVLSSMVPVGKLSLVDPEDETPGGLVQAVQT